ncbi:MAG: tetratricopeptide repeat protein [Sphingomicrobium sp.]
MKALTLAATSVLAVGFASTPAEAMTFTVGSLASSCYQASLVYEANNAALSDCTRALDEEPLSYSDRVATYVNRGIVRMNLRDQFGADQDFDTALKMDRNEPEAWLNKGLLRLRQNQPADAMPLIERAIQAHTIRPALALYARGVANEQLGHLKAAYTDLSQARDLAPGWKLPAEQLQRYHVR